MKHIIGGLLLAACTLTGCSAVEEAAGGPTIENYTCADLAEDAVELGENPAGVALLKVRSPEMTEDNRTDYTLPTGTGETVLLQCKGAGVFNNGMTNRVKLEATVDADEDIFVGWEPLG
jgi:hypothetical protein